jgi:hypothetical protein
MRAMIRKLFIEPMVRPALEGTQESGDSEESQLIESLASAVLNPSPVVGAVGDTAKLLDEIAIATPATARVIMAYVAGMYALSFKPLF